MLLNKKLFFFEHWTRKPTRAVSFLIKDKRKYFNIYRFIFSTARNLGTVLNLGRKNPPAAQEL